MELEQSILVADAHPLLRAGLIDIFQRRLGFASCREASSYSEAGDLLATHSPVTVLAIDLALPGLNGIASVQKFRLRYPTTKVIVLSETIERDAVLESLVAGINGYISKSLPPLQLVEAIRTVINGQVYIPPQISNLDSSEASREPHCASQTSLTHRQHDVLKLLVKGQSNKQIARALNIAEGTVKLHVNALFKALGVNNRVGATAATQRQPASRAVNLARRASDRLHLLMVGALGAVVALPTDALDLV